ncbi:hypothetical protein ACN4EK_12860 [Pantanalinema rosaneae CENA516]
MLDLYVPAIATATVDRVTAPMAAAIAYTESATGLSDGYQPHL